MGSLCYEDIVVLEKLSVLEINMKFVIFPDRSDHYNIYSSSPHLPVLGNTEPTHDP
jgi:hypothetical protein